MVKAYIFALIFLLLGYNNVYSQKDQSINDYRIAIENYILVDLSKVDQNYIFSDITSSMNSTTTYYFKHDSYSGLCFVLGGLESLTDTTQLNKYREYSMTTLELELIEFIKKTIIAPKNSHNWQDLFILEDQLTNISLNNVIVKLNDGKLYKADFGLSILVN
ncbi:hypothetical protein [Myroides marinus]|uniref:hypothetical protein n=1 Tax=Myroides marinus TaxID=703342 RepID=UPI002577B287|nr:hypothetical protein [Myroides marinus]MDM1379375.1 hypothetical protein [Myroides marinus]MDM1386683.1 hypothetical protein [Myroides marinus]MDM1393896.1 hypothetical protein [Myroides marinus]